MNAFVGDFFDSLMTQTCWVLKKGAGAKDGYGQESQDFTSLIKNQPCFLSTDAPGHEHEFKSEKEASLHYHRVYMRVPTLSDGSELNPHHWLAFGVTVNPSGNVKIDGIQYSATLYNVYVDPLDEGNMHHHTEVIVQQVIG